MSYKTKRLYSKKLKLSLILILVLTIIGSTAISWPVWSSYHKPVALMKLIQNTEPVFNLAPILPYKHELITDFMNNITDSSLNLSVNMTADFDTNTLLKDLQLLSSNNVSIFLSLLPTSNLTTDDYIALFTDMKNTVTTAQLDNVHFICYPQGQDSSQGLAQSSGKATSSTSSKSSSERVTVTNTKLNRTLLNKYKKLAPNYVGITLHSYEDLELLNQFYHTFNETTTFIINDNISAHYIDNIKDGAETVNYIYYNLAIKYPRITTIYNPYMTLTRNKWLKEIDINLLPTLDSRYINTYEHLISKPWITTKSTDVVETSPYQALTDYDTLSGQEEIILSPDSSLLQHHKDSAQNMIYANYRINANQFKVQAYYPYELVIDTTTLPNSINRIKVLAYNDSNTIIEAPSIDLVVKNDNTFPRAPRREASYPIGDTPIYTGDYIPILMYHTIADTVAPEDQNSCVQTDVFDSQMKALVDHNYTPITFYDLENYLEGKAGLPEKPILITMDDGYLNNYTLAYPIYKKYNIKATLFVSPYYMQQQNTERHFGFAAAKEMEESGLIDIESHGYDHTPFTKLSIRDLKYHISLSRGIIEQNLGTRDVFTVACPQFRNNYFTRKTLMTQDVTFQITKLAKPGTHLKNSRLKRINVPNTMTPSDLITTLQNLTQ